MRGGPDRTKIDELLAVDKNLKTEKVIKLGVDAKEVETGITESGLGLADFVKTTDHAKDLAEAQAVIDFMNGLNTPARKLALKTLLGVRKRPTTSVLKMSMDADFVANAGELEEIARFESEAPSGSANESVGGYEAGMKHFLIGHTYKFFEFSATNIDNPKSQWPLAFGKADVRTQLARTLIASPPTAGVQRNGISIPPYDVTLASTLGGVISQFYPEACGGRCEAFQPGQAAEIHGDSQVNGA